MRAFEDVAVGDELPALHRVVTAEDMKAYADVSGDQNPLHQDEAFARSVGFDGTIAHGMFTMGHMAACIIGWSGGDPATVVQLSAQFRAPVFMGERIDAGGRVRLLDAEARTATLETWVSVERDGTTEWPIKRGAATVRLA
ncbi:MAG: MaoC/PaaZ C-terminal domain-containing protein [Actinomycetota bacterium]